MKLIKETKIWSNDAPNFEFPVTKILVNRKNDHKCVLIVVTSSHRFHLSQDDNKPLYIIMKVEETKSSESNWEKVKQFVKEHPVKAAAIGLPLAVAGAGASATAAGFGAAGIVGGSIAAGIQSGIGNVAAGSTFALLQSAGMTGTFTAMTTGGLAASAGSTVVAVATNKKCGNGETEDESSNNTEGDEPTSDAAIVVNMQELVGSKAKIVDSNKLLVFLFL